MAARHVSICLVLVNILWLAGCRESRINRDLSWLAFLQAPSSVPRDLLIEHAYQVNLDLLDRVGPFFFRTRSAPAIDTIQASAMVRLEGESDHRFFLVGQNGVVIASSAPGRMIAANIPAVAGARGLAVTAKGRIAIVRADGSLNTCFEFAAKSVAAVSGCGVIPGTFRRVTAAGEGFLTVSDDGIDLHPIGGASNRLVSGTYEAAVMSGDALYAVGDAGRTVSVFEPVEGVYAIAQHLEGVRIPVGDELSGLVPILDISALKPDRVALLSQTHNCVIILDEGLEPISFLRFPPMPRPLRRMDFVRGLSGIPGEVTFAVHNYDAFSVFSAEPVTGDPSRHIPPELEQVTETLATLDPADFEPADDLLSIPAVEDALRAANNQLDAELSP